MEHKLILSGFLCISLLNAVLEASVTVNIEPRYPVVRYGDWMTQNCSTDCHDAKNFDFEITSTNSSKTNGSNWISMSFNINSWDPTPNCFVNCIVSGEVDQVSIKSHVLAFDFPENVTIEPLPVMQANKSYTLMCTVPNVAPVRYLTVKIMRGHDVVLEKDFSDDTKKENVTKKVSYPFTPQISDNGTSYTCSAQLDLRPNGTVHNTSSTVTLNVFAFPEEPKINVPKAVEANVESTVRCEIPNVFPPEKMRVCLMLDGNELNATVNITGHKISVEHTFSIKEGEKHLTCKATLENVTKEARESIIVYVLPEPVISLEEVEAGSVVNITCSVIGDMPANVMIRLKHNDKILDLDASGSYNFTTQKGDNGNYYTCETELTAGDETFKKTSHKMLNVTYAPEITKTIRDWNETRGNTATLTCRASGNPAPRMTWTRDGKELAKGANLTISSVSKYDTGLYRCVAENSKGMDNYTIDFKVEYPPDQPHISKPETIKKGDNVTLVCSADSNPPSNYMWTYPQSDKVQIFNDTTIQITQANEKNTGNYKCEVHNVRGSNAASVLLDVLYVPKINNTVTELRGEKGKPAILTCQASGNPPPKIIWTKDGKKLVNGQHLKLKSITKGDSGRYQCNATNSQGMDNYTINFTVEYPPEEPQITVFPETINEGDNVTISCSADSNPSATYNWSYPSAAGLQLSEHNRTIWIMKASQNHTGNYVCVVKNELGSCKAEKSIQIAQPTPWVFIVLIAVILVAVVAAAVGILVYCLLSHGRSGSYNVEKAIPLKNNSIIPNGDSCHEKKNSESTPLKQ